MILSGRIRKQLIAFGIASVIGILVLAVYFLRIPETLGLGRYTLTADFVDGAGLYDGAQVNFLGTPVGKVRAMRLTDHGIAVDLAITDGTAIPSNARAEIHSVSAVGEQYVELVPGPAPASNNLRPGDLITADRTSEPVEIGPVLDNVARLIDSVPREQLARLLTQTSTALQGRSTDLQSILDGTQTFLKAADASYPQTSALIRDGEPLLRSVNGVGGHLVGLTAKLADVTDQLRAGDADLRTLLAKGPGFGTQTTGLLTDLEPGLPSLLMPLNTVSSVLRNYHDYLAQVLSDYPAALAYVQSVTLPEAGGFNAVRLSVANENKPPECIAGFLPVGMWRAPEQVGPANTPLYYCTAPADDTRVVRGARNVPCPGDPGRLVATPAECRRN